MPLSEENSKKIAVNHYILDCLDILRDYKVTPVQKNSLVFELLLRMEKRNNQK